MSHDLRTPLNAIIGFSELMKTHWDDQEVSRNYLNKINESSQYLLSLINNILEMSKIESGKEELKKNHGIFIRLATIFYNFLNPIFVKRIRH